MAEPQPGQVFALLSAAVESEDKEGAQRSLPVCPSASRAKLMEYGALAPSLHCPAGATRLCERSCVPAMFTGAHLRCLGPVPPFKLRRADIAQAGLDGSLDDVTTEALRSDKHRGEEPFPSTHHLLLCFASPCNTYVVPVTTYGESSYPRQCLVQSSTREKG